MHRVILIILLLSLTGCGSVTRYTAYPVLIDDSALVDVKLSQQQIKQHLESEYLRWQGTPYGYGGQLPGVAADCSGFTQRVFKDRFTVNLPRTTRLQINRGQKIGLNQARAGDLVFFNLANGDGHVGIYLDNNIVMQAVSSRGVTKTNLATDDWWGSRVFMVKRILQ